jgi:hypothetical protein
MAASGMSGVGIIRDEDGGAIFFFFFFIYLFFFSRFKAGDT